MVYGHQPRAGAPSRHGTCPWAQLQDGGSPCARRHLHPSGSWQWQQGHPLPHTPADPLLSPQCITSHTRHLKINSSLQMPDRVLNFIKDHFLMDSPVRSQPLLLQSRLRYQQIGVHRAQGLHGTYDVLFLGTGGCSPGAGRGGMGQAPRALSPTQHGPCVCR